MKKRIASNLDPALIFLQADGFSMTYNIVTAQPLSSHDKARVGYAVLVNSALASELFLKCLICMEKGSVTTGHGKKIPRDLPTALAVTERAFEKLRYVYEGDIDNLTYHLTDLPTLLRIVILHKRPQWRNIRRSVEEFGPAEKI